jgi:quercetin dioxygenase-like cupin family protein
VEFLDLPAHPGRPVDAFGSTGFTALGVLRGGSTAVTLLRVAAGGEIGPHPAVSDQLLVVLAGRGEVRSGDGPWQEIAAGQAVLWRDGEDHATRAVDDLTALGVEAPDLGLWHDPGLRGVAR